MKGKKELMALFASADPVKLAVLEGLIEEAIDCKAEIGELKRKIKDQKGRGVASKYIAVNDRSLNQKRASYTNIMCKLCKELCPDLSPEEDEGLEDYE